MYCWCTDVPIKNVIFHSSVNLPEGNTLRDTPEVACSQAHRQGRIRKRNATAKCAILSIDLLWHGVWWYATRCCQLHFCTLPLFTPRQQEQTAALDCGHLFFLWVGSLGVPARFGLDHIKKMQAPQRSGEMVRGLSHRSSIQTSMVDLHFSPLTYAMSMWDSLGYTKHTKRDLVLGWGRLMSFPVAVHVNFHPWDPLDVQG